MKQIHEQAAAKNAAGKNGLRVRSNVKAGDFWDSLKSMSNSLTGALTGSSGSDGAAASGASGK